MEPDDPGHLAAQLHASLLDRGATLASAESLTGGELAALLTRTPGASAIFVGGVITYATSLKASLLGVSEETIAVHGVVSAECAAEMAAGVRRATGSDWALSTTGVAGPDRQEGKPVGTVFVGIAGPGRAHVVMLALGGSRDAIRATTCTEALAALVEELG